MVDDCVALGSAAPCASLAWCREKITDDAGYDDGIFEMLRRTRFAAIDAELGLTTEIRLFLFLYLVMEMNRDDENNEASEFVVP